MVKTQDVHLITNVQVIWHAQIANVKIHVTTDLVPLIQIVHQPIIGPFVVAKEATPAIHTPNVQKKKRAHIMLIVQHIFRAAMENASTHAPLNAAIVADAES